MIVRRGMGDCERVRSFALSLPGASEEPHFDMASFRVRGKIFATVTADGAHLHVFVDEMEVEASVAEDPGAFAPLRLGQRTRGLRILLSSAPAERVQDLIEESWRRKAPRRLVADQDRAADRA
ncbi:MAG TPA: MmcQ/YjbR family DNA-binding protein [Streptosporangiaceae bacterium]|nr:MmcQ/YjbR family DNA-binding protein [Streptosporangiaceae bacterium]